MLFDSRFTHSFLSHRLTKHISVEPRKLKSPLVISTPLGQSWVADLFYPTCRVMVEGHCLPTNLILLDMTDFDVNLGMDWSSNHHITLVCREKVV